MARKNVAEVAEFNGEEDVERTPPPGRCLFTFHKEGRIGRDGQPKKIIIGSIVSEDFEEAKKIVAGIYAERIVEELEVDWRPV